MNSQIGYAIKRTMKASVVAQHLEKYPEAVTFYGKNSDYILPGEGYWGSLREFHPLSIRMGWRELSEARDALKAERLEAQQHGYDVNFDRYDYKIVKLTITEEDA